MRITSYSEKQTIEIGRKIARRLEAGGIICLFGQLGSGKTVLAKAMAAGLGIDKNKVISPTFVLMQAYEGRRFPFFHFDFYRLKDLKSISDLGYEEFFYDEGVSVIEWAEKGPGVLPAEHLLIRIEYLPGDSRRLTFEPHGERYGELVEQLKTGC